MSWPWHSYKRSTSSYSGSFLQTESRNIPSNRPSKPKTKPVKTEKKPPKNRDAHLEKIELFACKICKKKYTSKAGYSRHFTAAHESGKVVKEIKKKPTSANIASRALSVWSPSAHFRCNHCGKELSSKASLDRHKATHDRSPKPKARQTMNVTSTTTNIHVTNNVNYNGYSRPNNFFSVTSNRFWD